MGGVCTFAYSAETIKDLGVNSSEITIASASDRS
jgi:hypothetical protein